MAEKHKYRHMHSIELQDFSPQARHVHNQRPTTAPPGSAPEKPAMAASFLGGISFFMSLWSKPKEEAEKHLGHEFEVSSNPTWCDLCGEFIWGFYMRQALRCKYCRYTCHVRCRPSVSLECSTPTEVGSPFTPDSPTTEHARLATTNLNSPDLDTSNSGHMTKEEVRRAVERYNAETNGLVLQLQSDGESFRGYIRVHMNLSRPVTVAAGTRPLTLYGSLRINDQEDTIKETTSFFLPRDTIKALHITSDTTVREVIQALLKKFKVTDNPRKFALFEKTVEQEGNVLMRVLPDTEEPLHLSLRWGPNNTTHEFVLQENEFTGEIMWDAFSLPELHNFLTILDREEDEHLRQVMDRYNTYKEKLEEALLGVSPVQCSA
ncbi:ras association domain-containing protein 1-like isoform X2 [Branchiostoma floridae x Branchiostoma belcheri]